jgi:hypothetical protein
MEIDLFPLADPMWPLDSAFIVLKSENRSALVYQSGPSYWFVDAADIVIAKAEGTAQLLGQLTNLTPLPLFSLASMPDGFLDFRDVRWAGEVERYMDATKVQFVILAMTPSRALVASRHEPLMTPKQASPRDCYCKTDRQPVSPGVAGGNCPFDSAHVGTVRCV